MARASKAYHWSQVVSLSLVVLLLKRYIKLVRKLTHTFIRSVITIMYWLMYASLVCNLYSIYGLLDLAVHSVLTASMNHLFLVSLIYSSLSLSLMHTQLHLSYITVNACLHLNVLYFYKFLIG